MFIIIHTDTLWGVKGQISSVNKVGVVGTNGVMFVLCMILQPEVRFASLTVVILCSCK